MSSPCTNCAKGCCRNYLVTVTGYDMWVIANGLNMAPEQFIVTVPQKSTNSAGFLLEPSGELTFDIALDKQDVEVDNKPCVFWIEFEGGVGRCGIYTLRPYVCQTYPATFVDSTQVVRREDVLCAEDAWRDGILQKPVWRERVMRQFVEHEIYGLAVSRWNFHVQHASQPGRITPLGYYAFLMNYYARLQPLRDSLSQADWTVMCEQWCESMREGSSPLNLESERMEPWSSLLHAIFDVATDFFPDDVLTLEQAEVTQEPAPVT
jgi:Fe-S-cluster containining protein